VLLFITILIPREDPLLPDCTLCSPVLLFGVAIPLGEVLVALDAVLVVGVPPPKPKPNIFLNLIMIYFMLSTYPPKNPPVGFVSLLSCFGVDEVVTLIPNGVLTSLFKKLMHFSIVDLKSFPGIFFDNTYLHFYL
jgi:hypothetical protein